MAKKPTDRCWVRLGSFVDREAGGESCDDEVLCSEPVTVIMHNKSNSGEQAYSYVCERHAEAWDGQTGWKRMESYQIEELELP